MRPESRCKRKATRMIEFLHQSLGQLSPRKSLTRAAWIAVALVIGLVSSGPVMAEEKPEASDPIVLLLKGIYKPVVHGPNLGLAGVNLNDGTWTTTEIHTVTSVPASTDHDTAVIGHFYSQNNSPLVAYDLPGGAILMTFTGGNWGTPIPDGQSGFYYQETWELTILKATGIYSKYVGGHNHMVDKFHSLFGDFLTNPNAGPFDENCYCIISVAGSLPLWWSSN